jgi:hypothetical protein
MQVARSFRNASIHMTFARVRSSSLVPGLVMLMAGRVLELSEMEWNHVARMDCSLEVKNGYVH